MSSASELAARLASVVSAQQEILSALGSDVDTVLEVIVRTAPEITGGSGAVIELVDGDELVYRAASGPARDHVGLYLPIEGSLSGHAVQSGILIYCEDVELDVRVDIEACRRIGIRSMVVVPLLSDDAPIGVLKAFSSRSRAFADLDVYMVQLLAGLCAAALAHAQQFAERKASEERYRLLFEQNVAGVFRTTPDGRILDCNQSLVASLGYDSRDELLTRETWDLYWERADREDFLRALEEKSVLTNVRLRFRRKDGSEMPALLNASLITHESGPQILGTLVAAPEPRP
jgi:PAS domain S-box-containing protein